MLDDGAGEDDEEFELERLFRLYGKTTEARGGEPLFKKRDDVYVFVAYPPNKEFDHFYVFVGEFAEGRDTMNLLRQYGKIERKISKSGEPYCVYAIPRNYVIRGFEPFYRAVYIFSDKWIRDFMDEVGRGRGEGSPKNESREAYI